MSITRKTGNIFITPTPSLQAMISHPYATTLKPYKAAAVNESIPPRACCT